MNGVKVTKHFKFNYLNTEPSIWSVTKNLSIPFKTYKDKLDISVYLLFRKQNISQSLFFFFYYDHVTFKQFLLILKTHKNTELGSAKIGKIKTNHASNTHTRPAATEGNKVRDARAKMILA